MKRKIVPRQEFKTVCAYPLISGDVRAYEIELDLGSDINAEFKVVAIRADGKVIEDLGSVENGIATYTLASSMYAVEGELILRLQILESGSVLTDREIIFDVEKGANGSVPSEDVVPLNDSVILRMADLETKLSGKVDKVSGKGLSANDFSDEYKAKLDNLDEAVETRLESLSEELDNLSDFFDAHSQNKQNPHNVTAEDVGAYTTEQTDEKLSKKAEKADVYTKGEITEELDKKADKSEISNVYKYCGSKETFEDLVVEYAIKLIPDGVPTNDGIVCGTFNPYTNCVKVNTISDSEFGEVEIPIKKVTLEKGYYAILTVLKDNTMHEPGIQLSGYELDHYCVPENMAIRVDEETEITSAFIFKHSDSDYGGSEGDIVCILYKIQDKCVVDSESSSVCHMTCAYTHPDNGDVYNVLADDMNYAWTGTEWDALGGEHKDLEAREQIEEIESQLGNIETALDEIINIQNSLIGGESV